ncbi:MAG: PKD domain-containing protein [bacterium]|nr:PKD domain-containing protein [bacterium]
MTRKAATFILAAVLTVLFIGVTSIYAWEEPVLIAGSEGKKYSKPIVKISPTGLVYVTYKYRNASSDVTDIHCRVYDGSTVANLDGGDVSESPDSVSYEPYLYITPDDTLHFAWIEYAKHHEDNQFIKYRYHNADGWSEIMTLGRFSAEEGEDLRLAVDSAGNAFVVFMVWPGAHCYIASRYADGSITFESFPMGGRAKHPDLAVDDNNVHIAWQFREGGMEYHIAYAKRANNPNGTWTIDPSMAGSHEPARPRVVVDTNNVAHVTYFQENSTGTARRLWLRSNTSGSFGGATLLSKSASGLYHWQDSMIRNGSMISSVQLGPSSGGGNVYFNWKQNGSWSGPSVVPGTSAPKNQSSDLTDDGSVAVFAVQEKSNKIMLFATGKVVSLQAAYRVDGSNAFWSSPVVFDASESLQLNPDINIVSYEWDFGDGTITSTTSPTISHTFNSYDLDMIVQLTITAENGAVGSASETVYVHALYGAAVSAITPKRIRTFFYNKLANDMTWTANTKNSAAGYPAISNYEIYRARSSSAISESDYVLVGTVSSGVTRFLDYKGLVDGDTYIYVIRTVDSEGHKSPLGRI